MIRKASTRGYRLVLPGIERRTLAYGEHTLMTEFRMRKGSTLPLHAHPHEQTGYLVRGRVRLTIVQSQKHALPDRVYHVLGSCYPPLPPRSRPSHWLNPRLVQSSRHSPVQTALEYRASQFAA